MYVRDEELDPAGRPARKAAQATPAWPARHTPAGVLALQRTAGNAAVGRMLSRLAGNPRDLTDAKGDELTTWEQPKATDAYDQHGQALKRDRPSAADPGGSGWAYRPTVTAGNPLQGDRVAPEDLYEAERLPPGSADAPTAGFTACARVQGSVDAPIVAPVADESLFVDPGPKPLDVAQGDIGDCYALATIIAIANRDPNHIRKLMEPDGKGGAKVTLYRRIGGPPGSSAREPTFQAEVVDVSAELAFNLTGPGRPMRKRVVPTDRDSGFELHGARLIASSKPKQRRWWAAINTTTPVTPPVNTPDAPPPKPLSTLEIHREDVYQMARWVPLLEKAIARFSQDFGQYGHDRQIPDEDERKSPSGLANLGAGTSSYGLTMFYGKSAEVVPDGAGDDSSMEWSADQSATNLLRLNSRVFDRLLTLQGRGAGHQAGEKTAPIVTAGTGSGDTGKDLYAQRTLSACAQVKASPAWRSASDNTRATIDAAAMQTQAWLNAPAAARPGALPAWQLSCTTAAAAIRADQATGGAAMDAVLDLLLVVQNLGSDHSSGSRSVYADHGYAVLGVDIKSIDGGASELHLWSPFVRRGLYHRVDVAGSTVTLMNPHHANVPDARPGDAQSAGVPDATSDLTPAQSGQFTIGLDRFLRLYANVTSNEFTIPDPGST